MYPTRKGLLIAGFGLVLAVLPALGLAQLWAGWICFWALTLALFGIDAVLTQRTGEIRSELSLPPTLYVGATHSAKLSLTSTARWSTRAEVKLDLSDNLEPQSSQVKLLSRGRGRDYSVPLIPKRRGQAEVEAAWVRYQGPLGLMTRSLRIDLRRTAAIVPNLPNVRSTALQFWSAREYDAGIKVERFVGDGSEFDCLREFQPGFDRRTVDWKASARHTKLLCRQFRAERSHQVVLAVDCGRLMAEPLEGIPRLDHAVHAALLLSYFSVRTGDRVSLFTFDERPHMFVKPKGGMAAFRALLQHSSELCYSTAETNYTLGMAHLMSVLHRRSLVIVLTDFVDTVTAELMIDNLHRLSKRHLVVFVALRDPLLTELSGVEPKQLFDLNSAVVADSLLRERDVVLRRLMRYGIQCIDAPPGRIGVDLVNRYLEIKRRELV